MPLPGLSRGSVVSSSAFVPTPRIGRPVRISSKGYTEGRKSLASPRSHS